jgi:hypothetical protein
MISKPEQVVLLKNSENLLSEDGLSLQEPGVSEIEKRIRPPGAEK